MRNALSSHNRWIGRGLAVRRRKRRRLYLRRPRDAVVVSDCVINYLFQFHSYINFFPESSLTNSYIQQVGDGVEPELAAVAVCW